MGHGPGAGLHPARAPERGQGRGGEQGGEADVKHLRSLWSAHVTSHDDARLNVGVETGQGLQSAGHGEDGGGEAHDHSLLRVMSAMK